MTTRPRRRAIAATLPAEALRALRRNPNVELIEADRRVTLPATQSPATWGLDRIDQRNLSLSNSYSYNFDGTGVKAYIIDTGIRFSHAQFGGRAADRIQPRGRRSRVRARWAVRGGRCPRTPG